MIEAADPVTISVLRKLLSDITQLWSDLTDRMHELLERNTDRELGVTERSELETLIQRAEFRQIISMALMSPDGA